MQPHWPGMYIPDGGTRLCLIAYASWAYQSRRSLRHSMPCQHRPCRRPEMASRRRCSRSSSVRARRPGSPLRGGSSATQGLARRGTQPDAARRNRATSRLMCHRESAPTWKSQRLAAATYPARLLPGAATARSWRQGAIVRFDPPPGGGTLGTSNGMPTSFCSWSRWAQNSRARERRPWTSIVPGSSC